MFRCAMCDYDGFVEYFISGDARMWDMCGCCMQIFPKPELPDYSDYSEYPEDLPDVK